ncbi:MAG: 1-acyl-sn-glycerol-3-phosphate acyltransferase [Gemmatimonadaceae bacterium]|nr:1-acyl-sn-glycerol-3-phosphate acyltransferase [Gemmatimonadaceae bacterium]
MGREVARPAPSPRARVFVAQPSLLYRTLRWLSRWAVRWIFRDVQIGGDPVPARGPVLLVVNHPNELCDILLTFAVTPRPIHFVGAIAHAASPVVAAALRAIGAVFVYRAHERTTAPDADAANRDAMQQMLAVLERGGVLAIFPEGGVRRDDPIGRLQPGAAALALRAVREAGVSSLTLVPVGIGYADPDVVRGVARVTIGAPLDVAAWDRDTHGPEATTRAARRTEVAALLTTVADRLGSCARASRHEARAQERTPSWPVARLLAALPVAAWGALTHAPAFVAVLALGRATMRDPVERLGRLAVPGVVPMLLWYAALGTGTLLLVRRDLVPLWLVLPLFLTLPHAAWLALRWADAWRARTRTA